MKKQTDHGKINALFNMLAGFFFVLAAFNVTIIGYWLLDISHQKQRLKPICY